VESYTRLQYDYGEDAGLNSKKLTLTAIGLGLGFVGNLTLGDSIFTLLVDGVVYTLTGLPIFIVYAYVSFIPVWLAGFSISEVPPFYFLAPLLYTVLAGLFSRFLIKPLMKRFGGELFWQEKS